MLDTIISAGSTSSAAPGFSRRSMKKSLADELDCAFGDIDVDPINTFELTKSADDPDSSCTTETTDEQHLTEKPAALGLKPKKSIFIEHLSPTSTQLQLLSWKDHTRLATSKHNRELIERNADGFFKMEVIPSVTNVERQAQQAGGIVALQRTLIPPTYLNAASSSTVCSHGSSPRAGDPTKRPKITFAKPRDRKRDQVQGPHLSAARRSKAAPRFSLARDLIASGHKMRMSEPTAPAKFVRLPTDPPVNFTRCFAQSGLKISIPGPEPAKHEGDHSGSVTSIPDVDTAGDLKFSNDKPKLHFGTPRHFLADQCLEPSCPLRWAHAKGPYHHKGYRHSNIMTGLFGHSNPPPEIWNAYRNMIRITRDGEIISPSERPLPTVDADVVIAFATVHYGQLYGLCGEEFHKRYAGRHMSSRMALHSTSTNSSTGSSGTWLARMISFK